MPPVPPGHVSDIDARTPVLVGVGQASERLGEPRYQGRSPVELAADAAGAALADTGGDPVPVTAAIDTVAGVRQFEVSTPMARAPLGRSSNYPRSVAGRIGAQPARAILDVSGGQAPQHLVNELAATIAAGGSEVALIFGSEAISTTEHYAEAPDRPDFTEDPGGSLEDRGYGLHGLVSMHQAAHGLTDGPSQYALIENARRARLKQTREEYAGAMGALFAPFTEVAAASPHAVAPTARSARELVTPTEANRPIADPYTRYLVAREKVNQGAAVLLMSVAAAQRLGIPPGRWVFLHGHADLRERDLLQRADLSAGPASVMAARHALEVAGIGVAELSTIDLYSCFPAPVFNICDGLGLVADDPRGLTVTGGLPFFGGPGNNYSMHAIAETVHRCRANPGGYGFVGANGGIMSKYSVGIYSTAPAAWRPDSSSELQAEIDGWPAPAEARQADGWATIETCTVKHSRDGSRTGIVIGRLEAGGRRFVARTDDRDTETIHLLSTGEPIGERIYARSFGFGNRVTTSGEQMDRLFPPRHPRHPRRGQRLAQVPGFSIDRVAAAAGDDPDVLRLENLDTDIPPPAEAIAATRAAIGEDEANSWLPFTGREDLKEAVAAFIQRRGGPRYDSRREIVIVPGEGVAMLDALYSVTDPGDEVILTDPTYAGMINRVRLVGAVPRLVPLRVADGWWRLDTAELRSAVTGRTRAIFVNNASFPSGWVASQEEWEAIADVARSHDLWLVYWATFEGVLFDGREVIHPAGLPGMRDRTVTVGDVVAEQRMIGWRIGWLAAPGDVAGDAARAHIYTGLLASGFAQIGARVALQQPPGDLAAANAQWQRRRDETMRQLEGLPVVAAAGGWSLLLDVAALGFDCADASNRLLGQKVAATPMRGWGGAVADRHVRFVFSNEPVDRLALMGERVRRALTVS